MRPPLSTPSRNLVRMQTSPIAEALRPPPVPFGNVAMSPLLARDEGQRRAPGYRVLDDALASGLVEIAEVSEQGSVPELRVVNRHPDPTLIVDGEELVGAKQNRVVNLTSLVDARSERHWCFYNCVRPVARHKVVIAMNGRARCRGRRYARGRSVLELCDLLCHRWTR